MPSYTVIPATLYVKLSFDEDEIMALMEDEEIERDEALRKLASEAIIVRGEFNVKDYDFDPEKAL